VPTSDKPSTILRDGAARQLLSVQPGEDIAEAAARVCDRLVAHIARLVGEMGGRTLFKRSLVLASTRYPWLASGVGALGATSMNDSSCGAILRPLLEQQDPESATDGVIGVLSAFVGLLERLIGERLVCRLLHELWPASFPDVREVTRE
jgi:hypothetical protein